MRLFPKTENFFEYFEELVDKIEEGGQLFLEWHKLVIIPMFGSPN